MISLEELVEDLKGLTPEQLQQVAQVVHGLSASSEKQNNSKAQGPMPESVVQQAVRNGWPRKLFTELIGSLPNLERAPQPPYTVREDV